MCLCVNVYIHIEVCIIHANILSSENDIIFTVSLRSGDFLGWMVIECLGLGEIQQQNHSSIDTRIFTQLYSTKCTLTQAPTHAHRISGEPKTRAKKKAICQLHLSIHSNSLQFLG